MTTNKDGRMTERAVEAFLDLAADKFSVNMRDVSFTREWIKATLRPALQDLMVSLLSAPAAPREREKTPEEIANELVTGGKWSSFFQLRDAIADAIRADRALAPSTSGGK